MMSHYQQKLYDVLNLKQFDRGMDPVTESTFLRNYPSDEVAEREYRKWKPSREREKYNTDMNADNSGIGRKRKHIKPKSKRCKCK